MATLEKIQMLRIWENGLGHKEMPVFAILCLLRMLQIFFYCMSKFFYCWSPSDWAAFCFWEFLVSFVKKMNLLSVDRPKKKKKNRNLFLLFEYWRFFFLWNLWIMWETLLFYVQMVAECSNRNWEKWHFWYSSPLLLAFTCILVYIKVLIGFIHNGLYLIENGWTKKKEFCYGLGFSLCLECRLCSSAFWLMSFEVKDFNFPSISQTKWNLFLRQRFKASWFTW